MRTPLGSSIEAVTGKERRSFRPLPPHDNERSRAFKRCRASGQDRGLRGCLWGAAAGEEDQPAARSEERLRHPPGSVGRRERPRRAQVGRTRFKVLRAASEDLGVAEPQALDRELEESHPSALGLHEPHPKLRKGDGQDDAGQARAGPKIQRQPVGLPSLGCSTQRVQHVSIPDPALVRSCDESERDRLLQEESLEGQKLPGGAFREGDAEAVCGGAEFLAAVAALFHVKR